MPTVRETLYTVIHGTDTVAGRRFDVLLLWLILLSTLTVCLESVPSYRAAIPTTFRVLEWFFTIVFTIEYFLRMYSHPNRLRYIFSFYGLIDFLSIIPTYLVVLVPGFRFLLTVRILRLLRVFRILKLTSYIENAQLIKTALVASFHKIAVFVLAVLTLVLLVGTLIYVVEGEENGFTSIPQSIYWAIVTITTVGYGDITPHTPLGQLISSFVMLMGYAIIAVPTGIVTVELSKVRSMEQENSSPLLCGNCGHQVQPQDNYCSQCGHLLPRPS